MNKSRILFSLLLLSAVATSSFAAADPLDQALADQAAATETTLKAVPSAAEGAAGAAAPVVAAAATGFWGTCWNGLGKGCSFVKDGAVEYAPKAGNWVADFAWRNHGTKGKAVSAAIAGTALIGIASALIYKKHKANKAKAAAVTPEAVTSDVAAVETKDAEVTSDTTTPKADAAKRNWAVRFASAAWNLLPSFSFGQKAECNKAAVLVDQITGGEYQQAVTDEKEAVEAFENLWSTLKEGALKEAVRSFLNARVASEEAFLRQDDAEIKEKARENLVVVRAKLKNLLPVVSQEAAVTK